MCKGFFYFKKKEEKERKWIEIVRKNVLKKCKIIYFFLSIYLSIYLSSFNLSVFSL